MKQFISKLISRVSKIPQDKGVHFMVGTMLSLTLSFLGMVLDILIGVPIFNAEVVLGIVVILAILKEAIWDGIMDRGTPDTLDFFATALPALLIYILVISL